jgi:hypothetical protein
MELVPERRPGVLSVTRTGGGPSGAAGSRGLTKKTGPKSLKIKVLKSPIDLDDASD